MTTPENKKFTCFIISAFGEKPLLMDSTKTENFDRILGDIKWAIDEYLRTRPNIQIDVKRSDEYSGAVITREFYEQLYGSDLVIAEISAISPNVFFELGVRFALRESATILVALKGTPLPFDLKDLRVIFYEPGKLARDYNFYNLLDARLGGEADSPVFDALSDLAVTRQNQIATLQNENQELRNQITALREAEKAQALHEQANMLRARTPRSKDDLEQELNLRRQACLIAPDSYNYAFQYGNILIELAHDDEAIVVFTHAVELNAKDTHLLAEPYRQLGFAYRQRGTKTNSEEDYGLATANMEKATQLDPNDDEAWGMLGGLHKRQNHSRDAIRCYRTGLTKNPKSTYCLINEMMLLKARIVTKDNSDVVEDQWRFEDLAARVPELLNVTLENTDYWKVVNRAEALLLMDRADESLQFYKVASQLAETPIQLKSALDNLTFIQKRCSLSEPDLSKAIEAGNILQDRRTALMAPTIS